MLIFIISYKIMEFKIIKYVITLLIFSNLFAQNDLCSNAISLLPNTTCVYTNGSFSGSSISTPAPSCGANSSQDVWYSFVATDPTMSVGISPSNGNVGFELLEGSCSGTSVVCVNAYGLNTSEYYIGNNFVVGQTYYVRILNVLSSLSTANFAICVQNPTLSSKNYSIEETKIYPNPVNDYFEIETNLKIDKISLYNADGQLILIEKQKNISIPFLQKGVYFVKIEDENG